MKMMRSIAIMLTFGTFYCYGGGLIHVVSHLFHFHNRKEHSFEDKMHRKGKRLEAVRRNINARNKGKEISLSDAKKEAKAIMNNEIV